MHQITEGVGHLQRWPEPQLAVLQAGSQIEGNKVIGQLQLTRAVNGLKKLLQSSGIARHKEVLLICPTQITRKGWHRSCYPISCWRSSHHRPQQLQSCIALVEANTGKLCINIFCGYINILVCQNTFVSCLLYDYE